MDLFHILIVFFGTAVGEAFGCLFGGGGFFVQPTLLLAGIDPKIAVANDVASGGVSSIVFVLLTHEQGYIKWPVVKVMALPTVAGSIVGALLLAKINTFYVTWMVIVFCTFGCFYSTYKLLWSERQASSEVEINDVVLPRQWPWLLAPIGLLRGLYDGLSGAGSGVFMRLMLVLVLKGSTKVIAATAVAVSMISLPIAGLTFLSQGLIEGRLMAAMIPANMCAGWLASWVIKRVPEFTLRIAFVVATFAIILLLLRERIVLP